MLKIVLCCDSGNSSSVLAAHLKKQIINNGYEQDVQVEPLPLELLKDKQAQFDIAMLCPHLIYFAKALVKKTSIEIPMYIIPSRIYGVIHIQTIIEDAKDILALYKKTNENPIHFPNEHFLELRRNISYRRWKEKDKKKN